MTCKHDTSRRYHKLSNSYSTTSVDCKLATGKNESFLSETVKNGDITDIMGELATMVESDLNTVERFINDIVSETGHKDAPTVVENNNETTVVSKLGKAKPVVVHEKTMVL